MKQVSINLINNFFENTNTIDENTNIVEKFDMDSFAIFNFIIFLEENTKLEFFTNDVEIENISTVKNINDFISKIKK